jgi:hypothetical protein
MAITRTPMIDDDGSGTTGTIFNNAWKQELYNQIDAIVQGPLLNWTATGPAVGTLGTGFYIVSGRLVFLSIRLSWPATADATGAIFTLPIPQANGIDGGLVQSYGSMQHRFWMPDSATGTCQLLNAVTGANRTNQELSGQLVIVHGMYLK